MDQTPKHNESPSATAQGAGIGASVTALLIYFMPQYSEAWVPLGALVTFGWGCFLKWRAQSAAKSPAPTSGTGSGDSNTTTIMRGILIAICVGALVASSGCIGLRQTLKAQGGDEGAAVSDLLGKYQAKTYDQALKRAGEVRASLLEKKGAAVVDYQTKGILEKPVPQRVLKRYDEIVASLDADVACIQALKEAAAALDTKPAPAAQ